MSEAWECQNCGYFRQGEEPGFELLGSGFVACPKCGSVHVVCIAGDIKLVERRCSHAGSKVQC